MANDTEVKVFSDPRKPAYLNFAAAGKPLKNPIGPETVKKVRAYRHGRIKQKLAEHDCAALLAYDPLNIRYATDCSDMQIWTMHNASRYALVCTEGPTICFEYAQAQHLARGLDMVDEVRPCTTWFYFTDGPRLVERANQWADEIVDLVTRHGGGNRRLSERGVAAAFRGVDQASERSRRNVVAYLNAGHVPKAP